MLQLSVSCTALFHQAKLVKEVLLVCRYFIYLSWMPSYFHHMFGMDVKSSSLFSFLPWTVGCTIGHT